MCEQPHGTAPRALDRDTMLFDWRTFLRFANQAILHTSGTHYPLTLRRVAGVLMFYSIYATLEALAWPGLLADEVVCPEYRQEEIREPVFILGTPRSGTTFLHRLLAKDERTFTTMRLRDILVGPSVCHRRLFGGLSQVDRALGRPVGRLATHLTRLAQRGNVMHTTTLNAPEEDLVVLWHICSSIMLWEQSALVHGTRPYVYFDEEMPDADKERIMGFYASCVQRHMYAHAEQTGAPVHYLSKSPAFAGRVDALLDAFPDARLVYLVRNPLRVIPSYVSLLGYAWAYFGVIGGERIRCDFVMDTVRHWYRHPLERFESAPPGSVTIVRYEDLRADVEGTVRRIYRKFGLTLAPDFAAILAREAERARAYRSQHKYSLERLGLSRDRIVAEYKDVFDRFGFSTGPEPA
jgi:hypothetical protein